VGRRFSEFEGFVFDIDGVLKVGETPVDGAAEVVEFLQQEGKKVAILTNNATRTRRDIVAQMARIGIKIGIGEVFGSAFGAAKYLKEEFGGGKAFIIGEKALAEELGGEGIAVMPAAKAASADFVVVGLDRAFEYGKLAAALEAIEAGAKFIATNEDPRLPTETGPKPGAGCMVAALSACAKKKPDVIIGKPQPYLLEMAIEAMGLGKSDVAMVGDGLDTDILMANRMGVFSVLVLTGSTPRGIEPLRLPRGLRPSAVLMSIKQLPARW